MGGSGENSNPAPAVGAAQGHAVAGDSIVLEEEIDPNYVPTQVRLRVFRRWYTSHPHLYTLDLRLMLGVSYELYNCCAALNLMRGTITLNTYDGLPTLPGTSGTSYFSLSIVMYTS